MYKTKKINHKAEVFHQVPSKKRDKGDLASEKDKVPDIESEKLGICAKFFYNGEQII